MPNQDDRRVKMTKRILKEALISLMHIKAINEISIKKICEVADVNRSTFYHHYQSPQELYDDIIADLTADFSEILEKSIAKGESQTEVVARLLEYIESRRELFLVLLSDKGNIGIGEKLVSITEKFIGVNNSSEMAMYCAQFISAGVANILWLWLNKEKRLPPRDVANLLLVIMNRGVKFAVSSFKDDIGT